MILLRARFNLLKKVQESKGLLDVALLLIEWATVHMACANATTTTSSLVLIMNEFQFQHKFYSLRTLI